MRFLDALLLAIILVYGPIYIFDLFICGGCLSS